MKAPVDQSTEGKVQKEQTTMVTQRYVRADFVGLRTVHVIGG